MTITGLCLPENASQIRFHSGKLYAFSGACSTHRKTEACNIIMLTALYFPSSHLVETKHKIYKAAVSVRIPCSPLITVKNQQLKVK